MLSNLISLPRLRLRTSSFLLANVAHQKLPSLFLSLVIGGFFKSSLINHGIMPFLILNN